MLLLFIGRRLFWLFAACNGFASGYHYAQQIWGIHSVVLILILSTHPARQTRIADIKKYIPEALPHYDKTKR